MINVQPSKINIQSHIERENSSIQSTPYRFVLWMMGLTSSGKTTLAKHLLIKLRDRGILAIHYDGDEIRDLLDPGLGFEAKDRLRVVKTLVHLSNKAYDAGLSVIVSALTANADARSYVKNNAKHIITAYVDCSIQICMNRDPKGLYEKAKNGEIKTLAGFNTEYRKPVSSDIIINTSHDSIDVCVDKLILDLKKSLYNASEK